ncbi:hypothetical protein ACP275_13G135600 [Erythranthe tilingii]
MVNIPVRFKRMAAAFDEMARVRSYESSGSEHSSADLSDLVNSFLEREIREQIRTTDDDVIDRGEIGNQVDDGDESDQNNSQDFELEDSLKKLFNRDQNDAVRSSIHAQVEKALAEVAGGDNYSSPDFKRRLMARLRSGGLDAGMCKSKWEKNGRIPSGNYEYVDVNAGETRYIVEVFIAGEFTIARPTGCYTSLLDLFPQIFVGKQDELSQLVKLMCRAMRKSMKSVDLTLPPWRRPAYLKAKWFGSYKRTINEVRGGVAAKELAGNRFVGFAPAAAPGVALYCRVDFTTKSGGSIGNLAVALKQKEMVL